MIFSPFDFDSAEELQTEDYTLPPEVWWIVGLLVVVGAVAFVAGITLR